MPNARITLSIAWLCAAARGHALALIALALIALAPSGAWATPADLALARAPAADASAIDISAVDISAAETSGGNGQRLANPRDAIGAHDAIITRAAGSAMGIAASAGSTLLATPIAFAANPGPPTPNYGLPAPVALPEKNVFAGNFITILAGGGFTPDFDGSRHLSPLPGIGVLGRIGPVSFAPRGAGLALNFVPDKTGPDSQGRVSFALGPVVRYAANRHGPLSDPVVARLGSLSPWVEAGIATSVSVRRVLNRYDSLSLGTDIRWDISGHNVGRIIAPSLGYYTPINKGVLVSTSVFADIIDRRYATYNYAISPAGAAESGLPVYEAHAGVKDVGAQGVVVIALNGKLLEGGLALLMGVSYTRLEGSAAETPITMLRGTADQWSFGAGFAYSF